ncbi:hypothetical protein GWK47_037479 [Chionoecetes opilio]|uniref:Uncharacterized protein n=1 Tax=Chionoecetes opilio TaxID=41210 RepID=A0A8J4YLQ6_CHIOP|nr:hypothetical protein GWK47_037479 [Chionoecetes opilio]
MLKKKKHYVSSTATQRKKLCVKVTSTALGGAGHPDTPLRTEPDDGLSQPPPLRESDTITDIPEFKQGLALFPLMRPFIPVSKPSKSKL